MLICKPTTLMSWNDMLDVHSAVSLGSDLSEWSFDLIVPMPTRLESIKMVTFHVR